MPKLKKHPLDLAFEILGIIAIIVSFALPAFYYQDLPDSLPRHYGSDGLPDAYGGKGIIWVLPIVGSILFIIIGLVSNIPSLINLPFQPDPEKTEIYQRKYARMVRILNVGMVCIFAYLTYNTIQIGLGDQTQLPTYFTPVALLFFLGIPLIFMLPDLLRAKK
jgi:uncharacterized membrane protein